MQSYKNAQTPNPLNAQMQTPIYRTRAECRYAITSTSISNPFFHMHNSYAPQASLSINPFRVFILTTPPTPNAGMILPIRARLALAQSLRTLPTLPSFTPSLLYKSRPSKCNGVLNTCTAAGVTNCAIVAAVTYLLTSSPILASSFGAKSGGRLNEAKMVRQSRTVKRAKVGSGTGRLEVAEPKSCVKRLSL
jgi:hypothetical protein